MSAPWLHLILPGDNNGHERGLRNPAPSSSQETTIHERSYAASPTLHFVRWIGECYDIR